MGKYVENWTIMKPLSKILIFYHPGWLGIVKLNYWHHLKLDLIKKELRHSIEHQKGLAIILKAGKNIFQQQWKWNDRTFSFYLLWAGKTPEGSAEQGASWAWHQNRVGRSWEKGIWEAFHISIFLRDLFDNSHRNQIGDSGQSKTWTRILV